MKNVLIIIDNVAQYVRIKKLISINNYNAKFVFKHSIVRSEIWDHKDFKDSDDSKVDVKNDYSTIIENFDLVISVHCFQFFPKELVNSIRCINVHPGYNPINRGWYPQVFAIINNLQIGATIHEMDEKLDNGDIIAREFVEKLDTDTSFSLYNRVLEKEIKLLDQNFQQIIDNNYKKIKPENSGNMFKKNDFNELCELNMEEVNSFKYFYDKIRALTHGNYKNAFFINEKGEKTFISIDIEI